jgi:hypothetical protein
MWILFYFDNFLVSLSLGVPLTPLAVSAHVRSSIPVLILVFYLCLPSAMVFCVMLPYIGVSRSVCTIPTKLALVDPRRCISKRMEV